MFTVLFHSFLKIISSFFSCLVHWQRVSASYVFELFLLAYDYSYWLDFFSANHVCINVATDNITSIGQVLALDELNGVSIAYQYSVSNIVAPTTALIAGENVQFVFSDQYAKLRENMEVPVDIFIRNGLIYDGVFPMAHINNRVSETKKHLKKNGAQFIVCFFDENSLNRWHIRVSDEDVVADYKFLLNWLFEDPSLGIIFKPKVPKTLLHRISTISHLIEQAMQTGRCAFLTSDALLGNIYPAEVALMSDIAIGVLLGATAGLESYLAGVPSILIDVYGTYSHPFYALGFGSVVFDNWELLRTAVEDYRTAPNKHTRFGDWSPIVNDLDSFQDGQASLRMGLYLHWVYEALKQGASKQEALVKAGEKFSQQWGGEAISYNNYKDLYV